MPRSITRCRKGLTLAEQLDAIATSRSISAIYRRYLKTLLPLRDLRLRRELSEQIDREDLSRGPILEVTPPFTQGRSLRRLIDEGQLHPSFEHLDSSALPLDRALHLHQDQAVTKALAGRNVVVATGTGSGKTESFLIPILDGLIREHAEGHLGAGVRALLLYPMNALANDQMKRLRRVLANVPEITFGRYIGDTREKHEEAESTFARLNPGEALLPNELLSRDEMRQSPPHLLLTNYAMLEYLLLRPADIELFEGHGAGNWRHVVLDEAHVYDGAKGAEIAMLLRRLTDRVNAGRPLQYIATSATVGSEPTQVTEFASRLFNAPFEYRTDNPQRQDLVTATRELAPPTAWGPLSADVWRNVLAAPDPASAFQDQATEATGVPADLAETLSGEGTVAALRGLLADGPRNLASVAAELLPGEPDAVEILSGIVNLASSVTGDFGSPVISARYHLWIRSTEGAFCCLAQPPHVRLRPHDLCPEPSCGRPMYEFAACTRCGTLHLKGKVRRQGGNHVLTSRTTVGESVDWFVVADSEATDDEDEDTLEQAGASRSGDTTRLCQECGCLTPESTCPSCGGTQLRAGRILARASSRLTKCTACGKSGSSIRAFDTGVDASNAVLATSLYQGLPEADDDTALLPGQGRKLLAFSDSRQSAAFFAPYLQRSYGSYQHRSLVLKGLLAANEAEGGAVTLEDLVDRCASAATKAGVFHRPGPPVSGTAKRKEAGLWIALDLMAIDARQSLEGVGLMDVQLYVPPGLPLPPAVAKLGLERDEFLTLVAELVKTVRQQGAMEMPADADPADPAFEPRLGPVYVRQRGSDTRLKVLSWLPTRGSNRRLDYLSRVLQGVAPDADPAKVLEGIWSFVTGTAGWVKQVPARSKQMGAVFQVDPAMLLFRALGAGEEIYRCTTCQTIAVNSVRGVCTTMRCPGNLEPFILPNPHEDTQHYRSLYRDMTPIPLSASEHTAQWSPEEAARIQNQFVRGEVNALSCSTTFELGVDVGELQSVLLRNVPPSTANYVQRAGRAGRRVSSAALAVTFANRRSHDLTMYENPVAMIAGEVRSPLVPIENARIAVRHAHSIAIAAFMSTSWHEHQIQWRQAGPFFLGGGDTKDAVAPLVEFLNQRREELSEHARRVLPHQTHDEAGLTDGSWIDGLMDSLLNVQSELADAVDYFEQKEQEASAAGRYSQASMFQRVGNTYRRRDLIGYLGTKNVLPKYGFPVDVVELRTYHLGDQTATRLDLERDLAMAIYEYAPGASIVAGGKRWTSGGVYRLPRRDLPYGYYMLCQCGEFAERREQPLDQTMCPECGAPVRWLRHVTPEFGFAASPEVAAAGLEPPVRVWSGSTHVLDPGEIEELSTVALDGFGITVGRRATLMAINEGPSGAGYRICDWCGHGEAGNQPVSRSAHRHLTRPSEDCTGPLRPARLSHTFQTDTVNIRGRFTQSFDHGGARSVLYALLAAASNVLQISRDDVDGTVSLNSRGVDLVIFDAVAGGAGTSIAIGNRFSEIVEAACALVSNCSCGADSSCYACLKTFRNQKYHDQLVREVADSLLREWMVPR